MLDQERVKKFYVVKFEEHGYVAALESAGLSFDGDISRPIVPGAEERERCAKILRKIAFTPHGENKALEMIETWWKMRLSAKVWRQFDTYRHAEKSSQSQMHTLLKAPLTQNNFAVDIPEHTLFELNDYIVRGDIDRVTDLCPSSFLYIRMVKMNYKTLQNVCGGRKNHKLHQWRWIVEQILNQLEFPELVVKEKQDGLR